ncbi:C-type mannose receptor 2-like [Branchiostoma floridae x Branchiostoma japonicum]
MLQVPIKAHVWCWVAVLLSAVEGIAECPDGYRMHEEICYKAFDENENFLQASETCVGEGGTLALPKNPSTDDFLISLQNDMDSNSPFRFGLVNQPQEGVWEWIDGTPIGNYSAWNQGVGNSQSQEDEEYCAEYSSTGWNVERCSEDRGFICQIILAGCTEEYVYHEPSEMCYKAYDHRKNYNDAVVTCFIDGGSLAMPRDAVTNKFLIYLKNAVDNNGLFRFGLTDIQQAGTWMWADNAALGDFNAWSPGEANNDNGQDEACAEFFPGNNVDGKNMWNDGQCSEDREFICQAIPTGCPSGYRMYEEICYKAFDENQNFLEASEICVDEGGTLAMPKDPSTDAFLVVLKNYVDSNRLFWFGLVDQHQQGDWEWIDGTPVGSYSAWDRGIANYQRQDGGEEYCAEYSSTGSGWNVERCSEDRAFICQIILSGCPEEYVYHEPSEMCYKAYGHRENYSGAVATCFIDGGSLAMPRDAVTNKFLIYLKNAVDNNGLFRFGLTDIQQEGTWMWADNGTLGNFRVWGRGEPNNYRNQDEDCAEYFPGNDGDRKNTWNDGRCSENREFICHAIPTGCPEGYVYHEPSRVCYKAFNEETNYHDAVAKCSSDGGTLAMPRDAATNKFLIYLKNAVDNNAWFRFGLTELQQEGTWMWADNVTLGNVSAWGPGEPNNSGQGEDCAEYFPGSNGNRKNTWNDGPCSRDNRKFICQVTPTDDSTTAPSVEIPSSSSPPSSPSASASPSPSSPPSSSPSASPTSPSVGTEMPWPSSTDSVVLAEVNVSLTLTVPGPVNSVNRSSLRDSIRQSLEMKVGDFCEDHCKIGEIFLQIVTGTNSARKKRQAADDEVQINVIIQLLVLANQGQGTTNATVAAESLLKEKAEALRNLTRNGDLSITLNGKEIHLAIVDSSNNCPSGEARNNDGKCDEGQKTPPWLIGVICAVVVVIIIIALVTVVLCRKKHKPGANMLMKSGNEMTNLDTPKPRDHPASDGSVDNIIYNTEDEGVVDNVIYNAGDDGTVDNVIYEGQDSQTKDRENAPEPQYESVN